MFPFRNKPTPASAELKDALQQSLRDQEAARLNLSRSVRRLANRIDSAFRIEETLGGLNGALRGTDGKP